MSNDRVPCYFCGKDYARSYIEEHKFKRCKYGFSKSVPVNNLSKESAMDYDWFVVDGYGLSLHWNLGAVYLIMIWQNIMDQVLILMGYEEKKPIVEILELAIELGRLEALI